eukprot:TRINITY_DN8284_c0_g1_i3.p1 TRINITY_DN8284_c0_g1~~TRINITY_DN8284_c0_g1_i3.p1  ORF type:complete len:1019 (-),score=173.72 TRINITY_DN8284_c0_g1_i3:322-3378(-)
MATVMTRMPTPVGSSTPNYVRTPVGSVASSSGSHQTILRAPAPAYSTAIVPHPQVYGSPRLVGPPQPVQSYGSPQFLAQQYGQAQQHAQGQIQEKRSLEKRAAAFAFNRMVSELWGHICLFAGEKAKQILKNQQIYVDDKVDATMSELAKDPLQVPLRKEWLNKVIARIWVLVNSAVADRLKSQILPELKGNLPKFLQGLDIDPMTLGDHPPVIKEFRVLPHYLSGGFLDLELEIEYDGETDIQITVPTKLGKITAGIRELKLQATIYISFGLKTPNPPFFEGIAIHMPWGLRWSADWTGALDFLDNHFLEELLQKIVRQKVRQAMVLPSRIPIPMLPVGGRVFDIVRPCPRGILQVTLLKVEGLVGDEISMKTFSTGEMTVDPFVCMNIGGQEFKSQVRRATCNPEWDEDNTFLYLIDVPQQQSLSIHVFDEDRISGFLYDKVLSTGKDECARVLHKSLPELLGKSDTCSFKEPIDNETWVDLASWWPGKGLGPDAENFSDAERAQHRKVRIHEAEEKDHMEKERAHQQEEFSFQREMAQHRAEREVRRAQLRAEQEQRQRQTAQADKGVFNSMMSWMKEEVQLVKDTVQTEGGAFVDWVKEEAHVMKDVVEKEAHVVQNFLSDEFSWAREKWREHKDEKYEEWKAKLLQAKVRCKVRVQWRPVHSHSRQAPPGYQSKNERRNERVQEEVAHKYGFGVEHLGHLLHQGHQPAQQGMQRLSSSVSIPRSIPGMPQKEEGWPTWILLVGIAKLDRAPLDIQASKGAFVECNVTPIISNRGEVVEESTDDVTKLKTAIGKPAQASAKGLGANLNDSQLIARKIGLLLQHSVPPDAIGSILDLKDAQVFSYLGMAVNTAAERRDVDFITPFTYLLQDLKNVTVELNAFESGSDVSLGKWSYSIADLLNEEDYCYDFERAELKGDKSEDEDKRRQVRPRITGRLQLWQVGSSPGPTRFGSTSIQAHNVPVQTYSVPMASAAPLGSVQTAIPLAGSVRTAVVPNSYNVPQVTSAVSRVVMLRR